MTTITCDFKEKNLTCPLMGTTNSRTLNGYCNKECCAWWNRTAKQCSIVVIAQGVLRGGASNV